MGRWVGWMTRMGMSLLMVMMMSVAAAARVVRTGLQLVGLWLVSVILFFSDIDDLNVVKVPLQPAPTLCSRRVQCRS